VSAFGFGGINAHVLLEEWTGRKKGVVSAVDRGVKADSPDVAVIGIPHAEWGEAVHAIVLLHEGKTVTEDELIIHCRERIAGYKLPKGVTFRREPLPLSGAGKVLKTELRKPYWEGRDRQVN
jgi:acyl-CoA synthetase (AMP-forming)/AMP-acid ligase II